MSEKDSDDLSALQENIQTKGNNSYYYAHGPKINGMKICEYIDTHVHILIPIYIHKYTYIYLSR
jgi:hypothetical protein